MRQTTKDAVDTHVRALKKLQVINDEVFDQEKKLKVKREKIRIAKKAKTSEIQFVCLKKLRNSDCLYVDKTGILQRLIENGSQYFLSRPHRFGKSLTLSTLEAMFNFSEG